MKETGTQTSPSLNTGGEIPVQDAISPGMEQLPTEIPREAVEPGDLLSDAGRKVLRWHFAEMLAHEPGSRLGEDIEALHDMRVATRRMRAAFEVFGEAFDPTVLKPHLKGLRRTGRALGRVRDLDVLIQKAQVYQKAIAEKGRKGKDQPGLERLFDAWAVEREAARRAMLAYLNGKDYARFKEKFNAFLSMPHAGSHPQGEIRTSAVTTGLVRESVPVLIYTRLGAVRAFDAILSEASIEQLHELRIAFKKLRYAVDFFRDVLGPESSAVISELKKIQDHLGDLNDADVAARLLHARLAEWGSEQVSLPFDQQNNLDGVIRYLAALHAERRRLMQGFRVVWEEFHTGPFRRNLALAISNI
jgi:CHAD domain-containing protein